MVDVAERIGIVLVHGIGEQRRFEHLEGQGRLLVDALKRRPGAEVTVDILRATGGTYRSEQNTWASSPSVRIGLKEGGQYRELYLHEVWWADVNEPYSVAKQLRFWLWGLSVWLYPGKDASTSAGFRAMTDPVIPGFGLRRRIIVRCELFAVSGLFLMAAFPLGIGVVLAKRLLNLSAPDFVQTIVNYVSGVKLYNQRRRHGTSLLFHKESDFLDSLDEPPRVSVRRRMIEVLTDIALQDEPYDRWYVLAHSLGSVVAFNGLMESGESLANYLGKQRWADLVNKGFAGKRGALVGSPEYFDSSSGGAGGPAPIPARPVWLDSDDIVYRHLLLKNFRGVLTYGSPLEKFAAIWPARVPVNKTEPHFPTTSEWINIYDPVDPVSGVLRAFTPSGVPANCVPKLTTIGFAAHRALLYSHLRYLDLAKDGAKDLGNAVAHWVLGNSFRVPAAPRSRWFAPYDGMHYRRWVSGAIQWVVVFFLIGLLGAYCVPWAAKLLPASIRQYVSAAWNWVEGTFQAAADWVPDVVRSHWILLGPDTRELLARTLGFIGACALITLAVGIFAALFVFKRDPDDDKNKSARKSRRTSKYEPEANAFGLVCTPAEPGSPGKPV